MSNYNADSIKHLSFQEGVRKRVGMYLGSADNEGVINGFFEVVSNATDEALAGYGKEIYIEISKKDNTFYVEDKGRGIPRGPGKNSEEVLITLMTTPHSGGKFDKEAYSGFSRGLNGIGASATCMASDFMHIVTKRDGSEWRLSFKEGIPQSTHAVPHRKTNETGSSFFWKPSQEVFNAEPINIDVEYISSIIEEYSYFNPGITFIIKDKDKGVTKKFLSKNGIEDFAKKIIQKPIHKTILQGKSVEDGIEIEILAQWTNQKEKFYLFVNGAECPDGGQPITGAKTAITRTINHLTKEKFDGDSIRKGLVYIISIKHPSPMFTNQTKTSISNPELRGMCDSLLSSMIKDMSVKKPDEFQVLTDTLRREQKAEIAAERARNKVLEATREIEKNQKRKTFSSDKLKDAEFLGSEATLLVVEGNSAASAITGARDVRKFGVLGLRGKLINVLSNPIDKIYENEEIKLLLSAMNINPKKYNSSKLRYGRLGICVDADSDGMHIALLIMAAIYYFAPDFIKEGRLFWLRAPLYSVKSGKTNHYFYSEEEYNNKKVKGTVNRMKGLGALGEVQAKEALFGEGRREDLLPYDEDAINLLLDLMGPDVEPRRDFIFENVDFSKVSE